MIVLDAGALVGLDKRDARAIAIIERAIRAQGRILVPATVLAQVWRDGARQVGLARLLKTGAVSVVDLDAGTAKSVGKLLAHSGTADVVDAHVIIVARAVHAREVVTSDPGDLAALDPRVPLVVV